MSTAFFMLGGIALIGLVIPNSQSRAQPQKLVARVWELKVGGWVLMTRY
jgi:hypothetical protein